MNKDVFFTYYNLFYGGRKAIPSDKTGKEKQNETEKTTSNTQHYGISFEYGVSSICRYDSI